MSGNYCLEGEDANVQKAEDKTELFEKLSAYAPNTWFADSQTGDVRLLWELAVPAEPNAVFNADGEDSGVLSDVAAGMKYSLDGGANMDGYYRYHRFAVWSDSGKRGSGSICREICMKQTTLLFRPLP